MNKNNDSRIVIFSVIAAALVLGGLIIAFTGNDNLASSESQNGTPRLEINEEKFDLGNIPMSQGTVTRTVTVSNTGNGPLEIFGMKTSCMCTSATLTIDGNRSPEFSLHNNPAFWSEKLAAGQKADLEITFDPNAHGPDATGPITRTVHIKSTDGGSNNAEKVVTFTGNVVK